MTNTNRNVNNQEWDSLIKEYQESGLSLAKWCQDKGYRPGDGSVVLTRSLHKNASTKTSSNGRYQEFR